MSLMNMLLYGAGDVIPNPPSQITFFEFRYSQIGPADRLCCDCMYDVKHPIKTGNHKSFLSGLTYSRHHHFCRYKCLDEQLLNLSNESFFLKIIEMSPEFLIKYGTHITGNSDYSYLGFSSDCVINRINELYRKFEYNNYKRRSVAIIALYIYK